MADPLKRPLKLKREFHVYTEKHLIFDTFQELLKDLLIFRPEEPLEFVRNEICRIAKRIVKPSAFILGPSDNNVAYNIGKKLSEKTGAKFLTLEDIILTSSSDSQKQLAAILGDVNQELESDEALRQLLVGKINERLAMDDCVENGYILYGFPKNKLQALSAQAKGLLPRHVFILMPDSGRKNESESRESKVKVHGESMRIKEKSFEFNTNYLNYKGISEAYSKEICKSFHFENWNKKPVECLEKTIFEILSAKKETGGPFIPKILLIGPPCSGKTTIASLIAKKYNLVNIDWMEGIIGASQKKDLVGKEALGYLMSHRKISNESIKLLLESKLGRRDAEKKGWIIHGFPENIENVKLMEELGHYPNRIILLSVSDEVSTQRMMAKRKEIESRRITEKIANTEDGHSSVENIALKTMDFSGKSVWLSPYSEEFFQERIACYNANITCLINYFGKDTIFVDGSQPFTNVKENVESCIIRPPFIRC